MDAMNNLRKSISDDTPMCSMQNMLLFSFHGYIYTFTPSVVELETICDETNLSKIRLRKLIDFRIAEW